jgi:KipI family sensor histidine kinase inhibitor
VTAVEPSPGADGDPEIVTFGDAAVLVTLGRRLDPALAERAQTVAAAVDAARVLEPAVGRAVPAHATVLVPFDPAAIEYDAAAALVRDCARRATATASEPDPATAAATAATEAAAGVPIEIPVHYGGDDGPDLDAVAGQHELRPTDVIELHANATYRVLFLGFAPGFAYLGGLPTRLVTPRRATPRPRVPAGSVGIAGEQTGVYPLAMPGGWQLIGRSDARLWDPHRPSPALLRPGDRVRFVPIR